MQYTKPTIVLAGNYQQYSEFIRSEGAVGPSDRRFMFGDRIEKMMGLEASNVVAVGTFWERKDALELSDFAKTRVR